MSVISIIIERSGVRELMSVLKECIIPTQQPVTASASNVNVAAQKQNESFIDPNYSPRVKRNANLTTVIKTPEEIKTNSVASKTDDETIDVFVEEIKKTQ